MLYADQHIHVTSRYKFALPIALVVCADGTMQSERHSWMANVQFANAMSLFQTPRNNCIGNPGHVDSSATQ